jgi:hypothetical protein
LNTKTTFLSVYSDEVIESKYYNFMEKCNTLLYEEQTKYENYEFRDFLDHEEKLPYLGVIGGLFSFVIIPTSIGRIVKVQTTVPINDEIMSEDLTNYDVW